MRISTFALVIALVSSSPAGATLQVAADFGGVTFFCADNTGCDLNPSLGVIQLADQSIGGVQVNGSIQTSTRSPNILNTSSLSVINTLGHAVVYDVTVSDTSFVAPASLVAFSGAGVWQTAIGSTANMTWWVDSFDHQGADFAGDAPGALVGALSSTAAKIVDSFSLAGQDTIALATPFSMTEDVSGALTSGGQLINRGQSMLAVPEPSTWAMLLAGFAGLALAGLKRRQNVALSPEL